MGITTYLVYQEMGWSVYLVLAIIALVIALGLISARAYTALRWVKFVFPCRATRSSFWYCRLKSARVTDERIRITNELICGMRVVKMYAWEYPFQEIVNKLRR